jgi:hypothetical protein
MQNTFEKIILYSFIEKKTYIVDIYKSIIIMDIFFNHMTQHNLCFRNKISYVIFGNKHK